ncbi:heterokaryon incompatibility [Lophiotrema nucula]|uniref:Heterokaryon incompatibility n=1 Tax=Lophiotrema nucula TaxID=690887 RepID=A0A6A5Z0H1_9PLEO|nr:heterokaryon incompatibility [Lophiotrema nucula]
MRLLEIDDRGRLRFTKDLLDEDVPPYAILSHTWGEDEVTFDDMKDDESSKSRAGYTKIEFCRQQAQKDGLRYFWVDTCCIDKANHTELSSAIISMFRWYRNAAKCYVYLPDVSVHKRKRNQDTPEWESAFRQSRWFTRGWTLQELLAPRSVHFFSREGDCLGDRNELDQIIHTITDIPLAALHGANLSDFSIDERMRWAAKRNTTKSEDKAYCLLGLFEVVMAPLYGEAEHAFIRLKEVIDRSSKVLTPKQNIHAGESRFSTALTMVVHSPE